MLLAYFLFLTPSDYSSSTIDFSLRFLKSWPGFLFVVTIFGSRFVALPMLHKIIEKPLCWFYYGISISGIAAFFVYRNSIWNLANYFIFPGLVLMPIPIAIVFTIGWTNSQLSRIHRWIVALAFFIFGAMLHVLTTVINWKPETRLNALSLSEYSVVLPLITICIWAALQIYGFTRSSQNTKSQNGFEKQGSQPKRNET
jgi:hypothetical protein